MAHFELKLKRRFIGILVLCLATTATAQIPTSFQVPVLGYLFDTESRTIRPIVGVAGSSRIDAPLALPITIESAAFLPDHRHAIVSSRDSSTLMVFDLLEIKGTPIFGARSSITSLEMSSDGKTVALYYADSRNLLIVGGLPAAPVILGSIDTSFVSATLSQFAISDDGGAALLGFSSTPEGGQDSLYRWTGATGPRFVTNAAHISDISILGRDGVVLDSISDQVLWVHDIPGDATPLLAASSADGLSHPIAASSSPRNEAYVGDSAGGILVFNAAGNIAGKTRCNCEITAMAPLSNSAIRLTDRIDRPIFVFDANDIGRIFFIPALPSQSPRAGGQ